MLYMVRLAGEFGTKSRRVRARFQQRLVNNLQDALRSAGVAHKVHTEWSRLFVEAEGDAAGDVLTRVFGVHSLSQVEQRCAADLAEIVRVGETAFADAVAGKSFAVRARRDGKHAFSSQHVHEQLGAALRPHARKVDLERPEVTVHVEIHPDEAYLFTGQVAGPGGLPLGVEGRAICLISGGFDSAVAAWLLGRRGVALDYVLCNLAGAAYERTVLRVVKLLADAWSFGTSPRLHVVDFEPIVASLRRDVNPKYVQVLLKRLMYRVGARVAQQRHAYAIITGESVGQVSSQTLINLNVIDQAADLPVFRPLIGMGKDEIIARAREIGTFALSAVVQEYCALVPQHPVTAAQLERVLDQEARLDLTALERLTDDRKVIDVRSLSPQELVAPYVQTGEIADGAVVIDCQPAYHFRQWHYPGAVHRDVDELIERYHKLDRRPKYVLYCPLGLQSTVIAERMQRAGYEAYSFQGGTAGLRAYAKKRGLDEEEML